MTHEPADATETAPAPDASTGAPGIEPADRRASLVAVSVVVALALLVGVGFALTRGRETMTSPEPSTAEVSSANGAATQPGTAGGSTAPGAPGTSPNTPTSPGGTTPSGPGSMPGSGGNTPGTPPPSMSRPTETAQEGSKLATVSQPPESTLAMIETSKLKADARYAIVFRPFGYGPPRSGQQSLVVRLERCTASNESAEALSLEGRNMLASVLAGEDPVAEGGTYKGVLTFRTEGGLLAPVISEIAANE